MMSEETTRLSKSLHVETLSFDHIMLLLRSYVGTVLLSEDVAKQLGIDDVLRGRFGDLLKRVEQRRDGDLARCEADRVAAWSLQMSLPDGSMQRLAAEAVVLCTYDRESAEFDVSGPDAMIESIMTSLARLGDRFCRGFVDFALTQ